jgi:uncharacterized protein DUF4231
VNSDQDQHLVPKASGYALEVADSSYRWYVTAAKRSRRSYRISEFLLVVLSASIPLAAALAPHHSALTAILGSILVVLAGLRAIFHWQENYLRFSQAREAVEAERRLYHINAAPYDNASTREHELINAITRIEHDEMGHWAQLADARRPVSQPADG